MIDDSVYRLEDAWPVEQKGPGGFKGPPREGGSFHREVKVVVLNSIGQYYNKIFDQISKPPP